MTVRSFLFLIGLSVLFASAGCGSTERVLPVHDDPGYVVSYQSNRIILQERRREWSLSVRAFTGCEALPCTPEQVHLVFSSRMDPPRYDDDRHLRIEAGGIRLEWPGPSYDRPAYRREEGVERVSVILSFADFRDLAASETVEGQLGSVPWTMSYEDRASLRSIVRQFE